jgi:hypothetical protein
MDSGSIYAPHPTRQRSLPDEFDKSLGSLSRKSQNSLTHSSPSQSHQGQHRGGVSSSPTNYDPNPIQRSTLYHHPVTTLAINSNTSRFIPPTILPSVQSIVPPPRSLLPVSLSSQNSILRTRATAVSSPLLSQYSHSETVSNDIVQSPIRDIFPSTSTTTTTSSSSIVSSLSAATATLPVSASELTTAQIALLIARVRRDERETVLGEIKAAQEAMAGSSSTTFDVDVLVMKKSMEMLAGEAASAVRERNRLIVQLESLASEWSTTLHSLGAAERAAIEAKAVAEKEASKYKSLEAVKESTIHALKSNLDKEILESDASIQALVDAKEKALAREAVAIRELNEAMKTFAREEESLRVTLLADGERLAKEAAITAEMTVRNKHSILLKAAVDHFSRLKNRTAREITKRNDLQVKVQQLCGAIRSIAKIKPTATQIEMRLKRLDTARKDFALFSQFVGSSESPNSLLQIPVTTRSLLFSQSELVQDELSALELETELETLIYEKEDTSKGGGKQVLQPSVPIPFLTSKSNGSIRISNRLNKISSSSSSILEFSLDDALGPLTSQATLFESIQPIVSGVALGSSDGFIFAVGQVNSGKSYSLGMLSRSFSLEEGDEQEDEGITQRAIRFLIHQLNNDSRKKSTVTVSAIEIFNDSIEDLCLLQKNSGGGGQSGSLNSSSSQVIVDNSPRRSVDGGRVGSESGLSLSETKSGEVILSGVTESNFEISGNGIEEEERLTIDNIFKLLRLATTRRRQGGNLATGTVKSSTTSYRSSLSHMIIRIKVTNLIGGSTTTLSFADLAGSEKLGGAGGVTDTRSPREAKNANESQASLEILFSAIRRGAKHIPFRDNKLTFCLKNELNGNAQVICLACVSQQEEDCKETVTTLNFAENCKATLLKKSVQGSGKESSPRSK